MQLGPLKQTATEAESRMVKTHASRSNKDYQENNEYYTPPQVFELLGLRFDLDVCSPAGGVPWIPADRHYSLQEDGLSQPWHGRVWMNPPFSKPAPWIDRFIKHGNGVCLTQLSRSKGVYELWRHADAVVLPEETSLRQSKFVHNEKMKGVFMPVCLYAIGKENAQALAKFGKVR